MSKVLILLVFVVSYLSSKDINYTQAENIAINWMKKIIKKNIDITPPKAFFSNSKIKFRKIIKKKPFYVFNLEGGGWIIVADNDINSKILAFSDKGSLDINNAPSEFKWWLNGVSKILDETKEAEKKGILKHYRKVEKAYFSFQAQNKSIGPLIKTNWGQGKSYNEKCPQDSKSIEGNGRVPAGCIAVAMAQIMNYYAWPPKGRNKNSYIPQSHPEYGVQSVDFSNSHYKWGESDASKVVYHSGVAVNMDYGPYGSGSYITAANNALQKYFAYYTSGLIKKTSDGEWKTRLISSLDKLRPILYQGRGNIVHAFVCDGYKIVNNDVFFHFNWGWNGRANGWFKIGDISPLPTHNFNENNYAIFDIYPSDPSYNSNLKSMKASLLFNIPFLLFSILFIFYRKILK